MRAFGGDILDTPIGQRQFHQLFSSSEGKPIPVNHPSFDKGSQLATRSPGLGTAIQHALPVVSRVGKSDCEALVVLCPVEPSRKQFADSGCLDAAAYAPQHSRTSFLSQLTRNCMEVICDPR
eukprot:scaffold1811_cov411-Prasinococcus_capsulatus_cf.AAC.4